MWIIKMYWFYKQVFFPFVFVHLLHDWNDYLMASILLREVQ